MNSASVLQRLYDACGFRLKPLMAHRILGLDASKIFSAINRDEFDGAKGDPEQFVGVDDPGPAHARPVLRTPSPENCSGYFRTHKDISLERKMWRARRAAQLISYLPFVRGVAVCNSLGFHMVHEESDVDLFIITAAGRVWSTRWWVTGVLALLRMRPGEASRDPVCVSFFVDERITDLSNLMIEQDVYFFYWLRTLMPLSGEHVLFARGARTAPEFRVGNHWSRAREFFARLLSESFVRKQQMAIMPATVKEHAAAGDTTVVLNDQVIKLHQNDRRQELRDRVFK